MLGRKELGCRAALALAPTRRLMSGRSVSSVWQEQRDQGLAACANSNGTYVWKCHNETYLCTKNIKDIFLKPGAAGGHSAGKTFAKSAWSAKSALWNPRRLHALCVSSRLQVPALSSRLAVCRPCMHKALSLILGHTICWYMLKILASQRWKEEDQKFKALLCYTIKVSSGTLFKTKELVYLWTDYK